MVWGLGYGGHDEVNSVGTLSFSSFSVGLFIFFNQGCGAVWGVVMRGIGDGALLPRRIVRFCHCDQRFIAIV